MIIYIIEHEGFEKFDVPVFVDAYKSRSDAVSFVVKKNSNANC